MKDNLKRFIVRHPALERLMFYYYHLKHYKTVANESERRKTISLFNIKALSAELPYGPEERVIDNNLYGYAHHLKKYAGIKTDLKAYLEHGLFWGGLIHKDQYNWHFKRIITLSANRCKSIEAQLPTKKGIAVGPYIHYSDLVYGPEEFLNLKKSLGKTLLVYPSHSVKNLAAKYDLELFIAEVKRVSKGFETVLISLYFIDAQNPEMVEAFAKHGFKIVTSGHKFDQNFVARQKTIIQLADMTMGNEVGTHVGYCVFLNKPHYIFKQPVQHVASSKQEQIRFDTVATKSNIQLAIEEKEVFFKAFGRFNTEAISEEQYALCAHYWGFRDVKTAAELKAIFG